MHQTKHLPPYGSAYAGMPKEDLRVADLLTFGKSDQRRLHDVHVFLSTISVPGLANLHMKYLESQEMEAGSIK